MYYLYENLPEVRYSLFGELIGNNEREWAEFCFKNRAELRSSLLYSPINSLLDLIANRYTGNEKRVRGDTVNALILCILHVFPNIMEDADTIHILIVYGFRRTDAERIKLLLETAATGLKRKIYLDEYARKIKVDIHLAPWMPANWKL